MSYIELAKQNKANREKAKRLDAIENDMRNREAAESMVNERMRIFEEEQNRSSIERDRIFEAREMEQAKMFQAREEEQDRISKIKEEEAYRRGLQDPKKTVLPKLLGQNTDQTPDRAEVLRPSDMTEHDEEIEKFIDSL